MPFGRIETDFVRRGEIYVKCSVRVSVRLDIARYFDLGIVRPRSECLEKTANWIGVKVVFRIHPDIHAGPVCSQAGIEKAARNALYVRAGSALRLFDPDSYRTLRHSSANAPISSTDTLAGSGTAAGRGPCS